MDGRRPTRRDDEAARPTRERRERLEREREQPRRDPRGGRDVDRAETDDGEADRHATQSCGRRADERCQWPRPAGADEVSRADRTDADERALRDRRHSPDPHREPEPDRSQCERAGLREAVEADGAGQPDRNQRRQGDAADGEPSRGRPRSPHVVDRVADGAAGRRERAHSISSSAAAGGQTASSTRTAASGMTWLYAGPSSSPPRWTFAIAASANPRRAPAAKA